MPTIRFLFKKESGYLEINGSVQCVPASSIVVVNSDTAPCCINSNMHQFDFQASDFKHLYTDFDDLLKPVSAEFFTLPPIRAVKVGGDVIDVLEMLAKGSLDNLLKFSYSYCLGVDREYFSALLQSIMLENQSLFAFMNTYALNQWSVERYAQEFGLSSENLNASFQTKLGISAKQWILKKRLSCAHELLISTSMRVKDIALQCGFSNHGHFTVSFRKRYNYSPIQYRLLAHTS